MIGFGEYIKVKKVVTHEIFKSLKQYNDGIGQYKNQSDSHLWSPAGFPAGLLYLGGAYDKRTKA